MHGVHPSETMWNHPCGWFDLLNMSIWYSWCVSFLARGFRMASIKGTPLGCMHLTGEARYVPTSVEALQNLVPDARDTTLPDAPAHVMLQSIDYPALRSCWRMHLPLPQEDGPTTEPRRQDRMAAKLVVVMLKILKRLSNRSSSPWPCRYECMVVMCGMQSCRSGSQGLVTDFRR